MKISLKWLCDHVDVADYMTQAADLAKLLTDAGLEVEAVENRAETFKSVVIGQITKLDRHPNADRLTVCQVDTGEGSPRQIVCGAKNHKQGDKVVAALPGAVLPGDFEIKKSKIRDVESLGMLASESELGLKNESEGILILPADAPVGESYAKYAGFDDVVFEINVTTNRADCLSHLGLARELGSLLNRPLKEPPAPIQVSKAFETKKTIELDVKDAKLCPRYSGRIIRGVKVGPSPAWLKQRLEALGMNSINNVVDVTNFVMIDLGQPLHAFDVSQIKGAKILVDKAKPGEEFKTFDGTTVKLTGDELTIRDAERAVCIAGVVGSTNSGVSDTTVDLFIESAQFAMDSVRKTSRRFGLQTDSAYRFSRGTDPSGVVRALERACSLIQQLAGGEVASDHWDIYPSPVKKPEILVRAEYVSERLGYPVDAAKMQDWMQRLGCQVRSETSGEVSGETSGVNKKWYVTPPEFRMDLEQEIDFVEEYGRLNGYEHIPETLPSLASAPLTQDKLFVFEQHVGELARAAGFSQCVNFGFTSSKFQTAVLGPVDAYRAAGLDMDSQPIAIRNPLNEDLNVMRVSLMPGLLKNLLHNYRHGNAVGKLFEVGYVFRHGPEGYLQEPRIAFAIWGTQQGLWQSTAQNSSKGDALFFDLKGRVQNILDRLLIASAQFNPLSHPPQLLHPVQNASVFAEGRNVGVIGTVHPRWSLGEKLRAPAVVGEIDLKALSRGQPRLVKFKSVSKFPSVERDLAFVIPKTMPSTDVAQEIKKTVGAILQSVEVFDVFTGGDLPEDARSVAYRMVLQDQQNTLEEDRLKTLHTQIVANVTKKFGVKVR
jgi:phenylalanyl-tRNA synthetase beta chain